METIEIIGIIFGMVMIAWMVGLFNYSIWNTKRWNELEHKDALLYWDALLRLGYFCTLVDWDGNLDPDTNDPSDDAIRDSIGWRKWAVDESRKRIGDINDS